MKIAIPEVESPILSEASFQSLIGSNENCNLKTTIQEKTIEKFQSLIGSNENCNVQVKFVERFIAGFNP